MQRSSGWWLRGPELFGVLLIAVGVVYFLGNTDIVRVNWSAIWPIIVIGLGVIIVLEAVRPRGTGGSSFFSVPREGIAQLELDLGLGAGTFRVGGGAAQLVEVNSSHDDIESRLERNGARGRVRLRQDARWFAFRYRDEARWEVRVAQDVPTALSVNAGAGDFTLDLGSLQIVDARMNIGAAKARIVLPKPRGAVAVAITAGAAGVTIQVPPGVEARVNAAGGLIKLDGRNETPGYAAATDRVTVSVSGGASSVTII